MKRKPCLPPFWDENDGPEVVYDPYGDDEVLVK